MYYFCRDYYQIFQINFSQNCKFPKTFKSDSHLNVKDLLNTKTSTVLSIYRDLIADLSGSNAINFAFLAKENTFFNDELYGYSKLNV